MDQRDKPSNFLLVACAPQDLDDANVFALPVVTSDTPWPTVHSLGTDAAALPVVKFREGAKPMIVNGKFRIRAARFVQGGDGTQGGGDLPDSPGASWPACIVSKGTWDRHRPRRRFSQSI